MGKKIVVFGSYVTDLTARAARLPQPGETVRGQGFHSGPGGKGSNQAVAAHRAGADVLLVTKLGRDFFGAQAEAFYRDEGMCTEGLLSDPELATGAALILVSSGNAQNEIVVIPGACDHITPEDLEGIYTHLEDAEILLTQLETNLDACQAVLRRGRALGCLNILNPAPAQPLDDETLALVDIITPNETEAALLTGVEVGRDPAQARAAAARFLKKGVGKVIITLGSAGAYATDGKEEVFLPAYDFGPVVDTTGAGDAFNGGFAAALAKGYGFFKAVRYGSVVSALAVTRPGTAPAMPVEAEIAAHFTE